MIVEDVILDGEFVRLEPMRIDHVDSLAAAGIAEGVWRWTINDMTTTGEMKEYVETALDERRRESSLPFVTLDKASDKIVGSTRFGNIDIKNRRSEIGWTWIHPDWQRTYINTEAKLLMLTHAFETWNCIRVELKTDALNEKSRNAILRLGAKFEGIFRQHIITDSGRLRDTAYFSIIDSEWPAVRAGLQSKMGSNNK
jgi:RimJ/RimL family protein N-acetyltransferase